MLEMEEKFEFNESIKLGSFKFLKEFYRKILLNLKLKMNS